MEGIVLMVIIIPLALLCLFYIMKECGCVTGMIIFGLLFAGWIYLIM